MPRTALRAQRTPRRVPGRAQAEAEPGVWHLLKDQQVMTLLGVSRTGSLSSRFSSGSNSMSSMHAHDPPQHKCSPVATGEHVSIPFSEEKEALSP